MIKRILWSLCPLFLKDVIRYRHLRKNYSKKGDVVKCTDSCYVQLHGRSYGLCGLDLKLDKEILEGR